MFTNVREEKRRKTPRLSWLPSLPGVTLGWHFTSQNVSLHFCKMEGWPQSSETYLEVSSLHTVIVNAVSLCSVSRDVFFIDFFLWFRMKFMQVAIFQ